MAETKLEKRREQKMLPIVSAQPQIQEWDGIKHAIDRICETDVSQIKKDDAATMGKIDYSLEAVQRWAKQSRQSLPSQNIIAEYRLKLNRKQGEWIEKNIPPEGRAAPVTENSHGFVTLADVGIDRNDSPKFRILAKIPEEKFERYLTESKEAGIEITTNDACRLGKDVIATRFTGDQESYTPSLYVEAARSVMGSIDCDPASNEIAQQTVKATVYYTPETNGLKQSWAGNIFLNPPYSQPEIALFIDKLLSKLKNGQQAILLTNDNTDTEWFHKAAMVASAVCFMRGRINFYKANGSITSPTNGQTFFYFGSNTGRFIEIFSQFGLLMKAIWQ